MVCPERLPGSRGRDPDRSAWDGVATPRPRGAGGSGSRDVVVLAPHGELDVLTVDPLRHDLGRVVDGSDADVVVDLSGVTFVDAAALGVLVGARNRLDSAGRHLRLVVVSERILRVFRISGLSELFEIYGTPGEARDAGSQP